MSRLKVSSFGVSIDGYGARPHQNLDNPLGVGGTALMEWAFTTCGWAAASRRSGGTRAPILRTRCTWRSRRPCSARAGSGEHPLAGIDLPALGFECTERVGASNAMHVVLTKQARPTA